jgi:hypothetical protein
MLVLFVPEHAAKVNARNKTEVQDFQFIKASSVQASSD